MQHSNLQTKPKSFPEITENTNNLPLSVITRALHLHGWSRKLKDKGLPLRRIPDVTHSAEQMRVRTRKTERVDGRCRNPLGQTLTLNFYHAYHRGVHAFAAFRIFCRYRSLMAEVCNSPHRRPSHCSSTSRMVLFIVSAIQVCQVSACTSVG